MADKEALKTHVGLKPAMLVVSLLSVCCIALSMVQQESASDPPLLLPLDDMKLKIVGATFVERLEGVRRRFEETEPDKFRGIVVTVQVSKPAGRQITFVGQDFTLHYLYGKKSDVSPCSGVSTFSKQPDVDRVMQLFTNVHRSTTGISTTKSDTVYVDLFFQNMEPGTSDIYLLVAQPVGGHFHTTGWK